MEEQKNKQNDYSGSISIERKKLPNFLIYMKLGYHYLISNAMYLILIPLLGVASAHLSTFSIHDLIQLFKSLKFNLVSMTLCSSFIVFIIATLYFMSRPRSIYLIDFACYKPPLNLSASKEGFVYRSYITNAFTKENILFQKKILERSGLGQETYFPPAHRKLPPNPCMTEARKESEDIIFGAIDEVLEKTGVKAKDIGILVVNCCLFTPIPSLTAMIVNHYNLRDNVLSYNLSGMGCSAGIISIDQVKHLLQVHRNSYALVVTAENMTLNWYMGNNKSMLVSNCLFRMGGAAILLSNKPSDYRRAKYQLMHIVRTHIGSDDKSYACAIQQEDDVGKIGVLLSKDLMNVAGEALRRNITTLGPLVLPMSEQLLFFATLVARKNFKMKINPYIPDFKLAFEHFCIHAGGKGVLDKIQKNLLLTDWHLEPSRMSLYRFGNTSGSSLWYELAYTEAKGRIKKGDRTWQIAFGSGFKCNSAVWKALKTINPSKEKNPWIEEILEFPVHVPKVATINWSIP